MLEKQRETLLLQDNKIREIQKMTTEHSDLINNHYAEGEEFIKKYDGEYPQRNLQAVLDYLSLKQYDFDEVIDKHRNLEIWKQDGNGWVLINRL